MFDLFPGYNETPMTELAMQLPMLSHGSAFVPDWDDDGVVDLWHHNHYPFSGAKSRWSDPSIETLGPKRVVGGCMVDWDAVFRNGTTGNYYAATNGFIEWGDTNTENCFDGHSTSYLDIDGDGYKDLFLVTGGGRGRGNSSGQDNLLFWGTPTNSQLGFRLVGGREAALAAGLNGRDKYGNERGRHQYWLDVDGDGLLDYIPLVNERNDDAVIPGFLYHNVNGRRFERVEPTGGGFAEFAAMAVLTDMDGDGFAREFVVPSSCANENNWVCKRAPRGTTSVYRLDYSSVQLLVHESSTPPPRSEAAVNAIATGDFDFDGLADVAILWNEKVDFHLSSSRQQRCKGISNNTTRRKCLLSLGSPDEELELANCDNEGGASMRFADFNLDGRLDMLILCKNPGRHAVYEQMPNREWRQLQATTGDQVQDLGELNTLSLFLGGSDFCDGVPLSKKALRPGNCRVHFTEEQCSKVRYFYQYIICNYQYKFGKLPTALGMTIADIDNDGYQDVIVGMRRGSMLMLRNSHGDQTRRKRFLAVRLDKTAGAAATIGAIVKLTASRMGPSSKETTTQVRIISTLSHETDANGGAEDRLIFGLGRRGKIKNITVQWPHCCGVTIIRNGKARLWEFMNSMANPYEVPAPKNCDKSCLTTMDAIPAPTTATPSTAVPMTMAPTTTMPTVIPTSQAP